MAEIEKTEFEFPDEKEENLRKGGKVVTQRKTPLKLKL